MCKHDRRHRARHFRKSSGNSAFDAYRNETLKRLEDEQSAFQSFLGRLREARDQAEFDQFMDEMKDRGTPQPDAKADENGSATGEQQPA